MVYAVNIVYKYSLNKPCEFKERTQKEYDAWKETNRTGQLFQHMPFPFRFQFQRALLI